MSRRLFNGRRFSENGWPYVDEGSCTWITVPGADDVNLQIQNGPPLILLRAWAADWNAYIEPLRDADSACWTPGNSVATSNHPGGTAIDLNWGSHPFQRRGSLNAAQMATMAEMEAFYEGNVFWAGRWNNPADEMHSQVGYDTYDQDADAPYPKVLKFIQSKIRADGFSTFRRGGSGNNLPLSKKDQYSLATINEGRRLGVTPKGQKIAICTTLVETNRTMYANRNVPASLNYPHDAVGADHDSTGLFQQRQAWGPLSQTMDPTRSAQLFYLGGASGQRGLTDFPYNTDARSPGGWAQAVQVSAFPDRYDERYSEAEQIYNRLITAQPDDPFEELLMSEPVESWSIYATPGEPKIPPLNLLRAIDAKIHRDLTDEDAEAGDPEAIRRVARTAAGLGPNRSSGAVSHALRVLNRINSVHPEYIVAATTGKA